MPFSTVKYPARRRNSGQPRMYDGIFAIARMWCAGPADSECTPVISVKRAGAQTGAWEWQFS